jgi:formylglycine-generating enzyme required for sulfatase activity
MPVGSFPPNAWGLYDMHVNVFEWCWDWYEKDSGGIEADSADASSKIGRVNRGGSWAISASGIRSAYRNYDAPSVYVDQLGFRLARNLE